MLDSQAAAADSSDDDDDDDDDEEDSSDDGEEIMEGEEGEEGEEVAAMDGCNAQVEGRLWRAGDTLAEGETLEFDSAAYDMLHRMHTDWPCLTFDVVQDGLGQQRTKFPLTSYAVAGTQAERPEQNKIICMKLSDLVRTKHDDDQAPHTLTLTAPRSLITPHKRIALRWLTSSPRHPHPHPSTRTATTTRTTRVPAGRASSTLRWRTWVRSIGCGSCPAPRTCVPPGRTRGAPVCSKRRPGPAWSLPQLCRSSVSQGLSPKP